MIPEFTIEAIRARTDLVALISRFVPLKKQGTEFKGLCPFHNEKSPSFTVNAERWHCFGCSAHGDAIRFLMDHKSISFPDAVKELAGPLAIPVEENARPRKLSREDYDYRDPDPTPAAPPEPAEPPRRKRPRQDDEEAFDWQPCVDAFTPQDAAKLAAWRGYSLEFVEWMHQEKIVGLYQGKVAIAVHDADGAVVRCHYRRDDGGWMYEPKGGETAPLIIGDIKEAGYTLAFESQWDAFAVLDSLGYHEDPRGYAAVITRGATSNTDFSRIEAPAIIAIPQNDPESKRNKKTKRTPAEEWLERIRETRHKGSRVLVGRIPDEFKDANDWIRDGKATPAEVREALIQSASAPELERLRSFLVDHGSTIDFTDAQIEALRPPFIIDGFLRRGGVLLLGAESKSRKSWLAQDACMAVAAGLEWLLDCEGKGFATRQACVHIFDLELDGSEIRFRFAKVRSRRFSDPADRTQVTDRIRHYCLDGENVTSIMPLLESARGLIKPGDLVVIDCLYRLVPDGNETADVAMILETVKRLARDTGCGIIVVDHFRKAGADKARDRFAGSFVKQASASTLVAVEVRADDTLELSVDARSFHGTPKVWCRWNPHTYGFDQVRESEIIAASNGKKLADAHAWLSRVWKSRDLAAGVTALDASVPWGISKEAARGRFTKLLELGLVSCVAEGRAHSFLLTPAGTESVNTFIHLSR